MPAVRFAEDSALLSAASAEALMRAIEAAPQVRRRFQFFVWMQSRLKGLVPHEIAVCGSYVRARRELCFEVFHSTVVGQPTLAMLADGRSDPLGQIIALWQRGDGRATAIKIDAAATDAQTNWQSSLADEGFRQLLVHGVSRPQRPAEIETLFIFADRGAATGDEALLHLELLLPHVHSTYLRVQATEIELGHSAIARAASAPAVAAASPITRREQQILGWVREGMSNPQIAEQLQISPLTVKNHVQKILRKLGASNRAQAVAVAMTAGLLPSAQA
jgi:transcriptional regulator EpsA